jgi:hypothetical protein
MRRVRYASRDLSTPCSLCGCVIEAGRAYIGRYTYAPGRGKGRRFRATHVYTADCPRRSGGAEGAL